MLEADDGSHERKRGEDGVDAEGEGGWGRKRMVNLHVAHVSILPRMLINHIGPKLRCASPICSRTGFNLRDLSLARLVRCQQDTHSNFFEIVDISSRKQEYRK